MLPISSRMQQLLNQSTPSRVAYSTASNDRHGPRLWVTGFPFRLFVFLDCWIKKKAILGSENGHSQNLERSEAQEPFSRSARSKRSFRASRLGLIFFCGFQGVLTSGAFSPSSGSRDGWRAEDVGAGPADGVTVRVGRWVCLVS